LTYAVCRWFDRLVDGLIDWWSMGWLIDSLIDWLCWSVLVVVCCLLDAVCCLMYAGCWLKCVGCRMLFVVCCVLFDVCCLPLAWVTCSRHRQWPADSVTREEILIV
jgi:hypothetical protein